MSILQWNSKRWRNYCNSLYWLEFACCHPTKFVRLMTRNRVFRMDQVSIPLDQNRMDINCNTLKPSVSSDNDIDESLPTHSIEYLMSYCRNNKCNAIFFQFHFRLVSKPAPQFEGTAVINGEFTQFSLTDYIGKYVVFFFYPLDLWVWSLFIHNIFFLW